MGKRIFLFTCLLYLFILLLFFSSNAFALTIYTNAHGVIRYQTMFPYPYTFDDTKTGSAGTISAYVDQDSDDVNASTFWPQYSDGPYEPLETGDNASSSALASSNGFLSVSVQCERPPDDQSFPEKLWFNALASNEFISC